MAEDENTAAKSYDRAREITEKALDAYAKGDEKSGAALVEQAKSVNPDAVRDVQQELDEDATSEHDPEKLKEMMTKKDKG